MEKESPLASLQRWQSYCFSQDSLGTPGGVLVEAILPFQRIRHIIESVWHLNVCVCVYACFMPLL